MLSVTILLVQLMLASIAVQHVMTSPAQFSLAESESLQSLIRNTIEQEVSYDSRRKKAAALERLMDVLEVEAPLRRAHTKRHILDLDVLPDGRRKRTATAARALERLLNALEVEARRGSIARRAAYISPDILDLDVLPDGRRKRGPRDWILEIPMDTNYDGRRRKRSNYKKSLAVYSNLRPLIAPDIIHMGRRSAALSGGYMLAAHKRFLDTVGGGHIQPLEGRRRKRLLDTLVRARPIFDGKRG